VERKTVDGGRKTGSEDRLAPELQTKRGFPQEFIFKLGAKDFVEIAHTSFYGKGPELSKEVHSRICP